MRRLLQICNCCCVGHNCRRMNDMFGILSVNYIWKISRGATRSHAECGVGQEEGFAQNTIYTGILGILLGSPLSEREDIAGREGVSNPLLLCTSSATTTTNTTTTSHCYIKPRNAHRPDRQNGRFSWRRGKGVVFCQPICELKIRF